MNLSSLTKEQKQYIVLGIIVSVAAVVLAVFGIKISLGSIATAKTELADLTEKIEKADRALSKREATSAEYLKSAGDLKLLLSNVPPSQNKYDWATEVIYSQARDAELEIDAIDELSQAPAPAQGEAAATSLQLDSYALRITAHGNYFNVLGFLALMEDRHPMARLTGLEISAGPQKDLHDIQLIIQWPLTPDAMMAAWEAIAAKQKTIDQKPMMPRPGTHPEPVAEAASSKVSPVPEATPAPVVDVPEPEPRTETKPVELPPVNTPDAATQPKAEVAGENLLDDLLLSMTKSVLEPMDAPDSGKGTDDSGNTATGLGDSRNASTKNAEPATEPDPTVPME